MLGSIQELLPAHCASISLPSSLPPSLLPFRPSTTHNPISIPTPSSEPITMATVFSVALQFLLKIFFSAPSFNLSFSPLSVSIPAFALFSFLFISWLLCFLLSMCPCLLLFRSVSLQLPSCLSLFKSAISGDRSEIGFGSKEGKTDVHKWNGLP